MVGITKQNLDKLIRETKITRKTNNNLACMTSIIIKPLILELHEIESFTINFTITTYIFL